MPTFGNLSFCDTVFCLFSFFLFVLLRKNKQDVKLLFFDVLWCPALLLECGNIFTAHLRLADYTPVTFANSLAFCPCCWYI